MATFEKPKRSESVPVDLLPVIRNSGVLADRQCDFIQSKVLSGEYPQDPRALADLLVREKLLTEYQVKRFLAGKSHGLVVGRYAILDRLGSGSMGRVYKAHHLMMDRVVALKIIAPEIATNERVVARFQREMKLVGRLDHPNVVRAFDADKINAVLFIVMEYVSGVSLGQRLREGLVPPAEMINYAAQAALGLAHAHSQGIVHRDVKPSNLLVTEDKKIKVLDLGLGVLMDADNAASFATADGIAVGTVDYMSPEQACGREVDGRSDLFSLGCATYHLITGRLPFPGESPIDRLGRRITGKPVPIAEVMPDIPASLIPVMDKLLANKPQERFQTADEAAEALQGLIRPRNRPGSASMVRKSPPAPEPSPSPPPAAPAPAPEGASLAYSIMKVRPDYPAWFRPLASLAERQPTGALLAVLGTLGVVFGSGFGLAWLLR
jgi:serine/threonine protein kinase